MLASKHLLKKAVEIGGVGEGGGVRLDHGWGVLAQVAQMLLGHLCHYGRSCSMVLLKTEYLLHEDGVVTLCCHCCVRQPKESAKP